MARGATGNVCQGFGPIFCNSSNTRAAGGLRLGSHINMFWTTPHNPYSWSFPCAGLSSLPVVSCATVMPKTWHCAKNDCHRQAFWMVCCGKPSCNSALIAFTSLRLVAMPWPHNVHKQEANAQTSRAGPTQFSMSLGLVKVM